MSLKAIRQMGVKYNSKDIRNRKSWCLYVAVESLYRIAVWIITQGRDQRTDKISSVAGLSQGAFLFLMIEFMLTCRSILFFNDIFHIFCVLASMKIGPPPPFILSL